MLTVGSLFSGVAGFDLGFERAGFRTAWQVEQEPFCLAVLATHFPKAERFTDVLEVGAGNLARVDVITAGVPCQDVSVAGKRAGLAGERTGLFYEFARILQELRPPWFVFENVPGIFSSNHGRDFAEVLRVLMADCGYGVAWRVLNSQFFGVAQRRRRVFIVGRLGAPCPATILFEPESRARDLEAGSEEGKDIAAPLTSGSGVTSNAPIRRREDDINLVASSGERERALTGSMWKRHDEDTDTPVAAFQNTGRGWWNERDTASTVCTPEGSGSREANLVATLNIGGNSGGFWTEPGEHLAIAFTERTRAEGRTLETQNELAYALTNPGSGGRTHSRQILQGMSVRRLTPRECERLQGFPDDYTIPAGKTEQGLDSARYRALGNAVTVSVGEWIGHRILEFERSCAV